MVAALLLRGVPLLRRLRHHQGLAAGIYQRRPWSVAAESTRPEEPTAALTVKEPPPPRYLNNNNNNNNNTEYRKWKVKEEEIFRDIEPITLLAKEILHSDRYMDGERLTQDDEKAVLEKLLAYHPHSEDKIGCGFDSIMVDRHPQFRQSRCLFVIRTDGGWIDFSYQKCIREYIRQKYPSHAVRFIKEHFKRGSG